MGLEIWLCLGSDLVKLGELGWFRHLVVLDICLNRKFSWVAVHLVGLV